MYNLKYKRTFHLPWSPGATNDDKIAKDISSLINIPIIITEKMDGSNASLETDGCFARTHSGVPTHASFDGLKALHANIKYQIPEGFQLFGEWCFAKHSIEYNELPGYFLLFNVRSLHTSMWASWEGVEMWATELGLPTVPVLFKGQVSSEKELQTLIEDLMTQTSACGGIREGVVARLEDGFSDNNFSKCVMKCVRANHVQTSDHWKDSGIIRNKLRLLTT
jgi:hypothetical protein